jgi:hypothetical protein
MGEWDVRRKKNLRLIGTKYVRRPITIAILSYDRPHYLAKGVALDIPAAPERGRGSWRCRLPCRVHLGGAFHERLL